MAKLLQINVTANWGSHGRIAETIGGMALDQGWEWMMAYGRQMDGRTPTSRSQLVRVGSEKDIMLHLLATRLFDRHGLASRAATKRFLEQAEAFNPDIVHLHNIHGYYLNYEELFRWLERKGVPVVWTFHDCWPLTGHCAHFEYDGCDRWRTQCHDCPIKGVYPSSNLLDRSAANHKLKRELFPLRPGQLTTVAVSQWLAGHIADSYLGASDIRLIHNGINIDRFYPDVDEAATMEVKGKYGAEGQKLVLGVASVWTDRKGLADFIKLRRMLPLDSYKIMLVGLNAKQMKQLPEGVIGIMRTQNVEEMRSLYAAADLFVNPTYEDSFPTTNLEALACGTPVVTYRTGGSPESVTFDADTDTVATGMVVEKGDLERLTQAIRHFAEMAQADKGALKVASRARAERLFNATDRFADYLALYDEILRKGAK